MCFFSKIVFQTYYKPNIMLKKTIKINPELFNIADKTKKIREKKTKPNIPLVIRPNSLKKELLNKIKEHRTREFGSSEKQTFSDEFRDSINYLSSLSQKKKEDSAREKMRELISNKTVKNYHSYNTPDNPNKNGGFHNYNSFMPVVNLELPEELQETYTPALIEPMSSPIKINSYIPKAENEIPYGCLKGGQKPTFRAWQATRKNYEAISPTPTMQKPLTFQEQPPILNDSIVSDSVNDRERKLELLRMKMRRQMEEEKYRQQMEEASQRPEPTPVIISEPDTSILNTNIPASNELKQNLDAMIEPPEKKFIKRTIKRKYTLGKSKIHNTVSILLKDNQTRKNVVNAQKELKRTPINDIKKYLKTRGLIKVGSNAPNDVLRKTYESAILSGEVLNKNKDTLLHNFLNDTEH
jgi:hypothetical protein